jgi:hypothetical protein
VTTLPRKLAAGRESSARMLEANLRTHNGDLTIKKALKEYAAEADTYRLSVYNIHSIPDLKEEYEREQKSLIAKCQDKWDAYVARAEKMEKSGEIRLTKN